MDRFKALNTPRSTSHRNSILNFDSTSNFNSSDTDSSSFDDDGRATERLEAALALLSLITVVIVFVNLELARQHVISTFGFYWIPVRNIPIAAASSCWFRVVYCSAYSNTVIDWFFMLFWHAERSKRGPEPKLGSWR